MQGIKFKDLYNILDKGSTITCFMEFEGCSLFDSGSDFPGKRDLSKVEDLIVTQLSNNNGNEWNVYLKKPTKI